MKYIAFILAFFVGFIVWFCTAGIIFTILKMKGVVLGAIPLFLMVAVLIWLVKYFYKIFLHKIGYKFENNEEK